MRILQAGTRQGAPLCRTERPAAAGGIRFSDDELKAYLFKKADKNKDQMINRKEWEEFYNSLMDMEPEGGTSRRHRDIR